jgi:hypothetical protein
VTSILTPNSGPSLRRNLNCPTTQIPLRIWSTVFLAGWAFVLVLAIRLLGALGSGSLAAPRLTDPSAIWHWATTTPPADLLMTMLRLAGVAMGWYLLALMALGVLARATRFEIAATKLNRWTPRSLHTLLDNAMGFALLAALTLASLTPIRSTASPQEFALGPDPMVLVLQPDTSTEPPILELDAFAMSDVPMVMRRAESPSLAPKNVSTAQEWVVVPGDNLWSIAESTLAGHFGSEVSIAQITPYWIDLTTANRSRLSDPSNPDLLLVGQTLLVPSVE